MSELTALPSSPTLSSEPNPPLSFDWRKIVESPEGRAAIAILIGILVAFSSLFKKLTGLWFEADSLYSHGPLVPILAGYVVYERWPYLRKFPVRGVVGAIVPLLLIMYATWFASRTAMPGVLSALLMMAIAFSVLFVGGWRWFGATLGPVLYLVFAFPFWGGLVDRMTQPLQALSTDMAVRILDLSGLHPYRLDSTTIYLDHFQLNVAAACSGAKLTLALFTFAVFFILLNRGRWYSAVALLIILLPFSLMINGLRIALVGVVGNAFGTPAGMMFHDYGGYVVLIFCFVLLAQITRLLGFKS